MLGKPPKPDLMLPEQKLQALSFCDAAPKAFKQWVDSLPVANIGEASRQLYNAIIELNQLDLPAQQRLQLLEMLRPRIYVICEQLARHYLGHAVALPEKQRKIANLCQALQLHTAHGYKAVLMGRIDKGAPDKQRHQVAMAAHRAITDLSATILRAAQLYGPGPARCWFEAHQIFRYIRARKFAQLAIEDSTAGIRKESSVEDAYKRLLILGACRPNQMRQSDLAQVYQVLEVWSTHVTVDDRKVDQAPFIINTERDLPPVARERHNDNITRAHLGLNTSALSQGLEKLIEQKQPGKTPSTGDGLELPIRISDAVIMHLSQSLGDQATRSFKRVPSEGSIRVCVGMSAVHYYVADQTPFHEFLADEDDQDENVFLAHDRNRDIWSNSFDARPTDTGLSSGETIDFKSSMPVEPSETSKPAAFPTYTVPLVNTSPGGFCLSWDQEMPAALQSGEILGLRESDEQPWGIGVIRWIRQNRQEGTRIGVELLAPNASPCGVQLLQKTGNTSEFLRALLLPELTSIGQPATVITPRMPFQAGHRIILFHDGEAEQTQLSKRVAATGSVSQFELKFRQRRTAKHRGGDQPSTSGEEDFDSIWRTL